jgi:NAD(P)-dependent dehydrogenase (short-subunit alcohol dehydrogenase family)
MAASEPRNVLVTGVTRGLGRVMVDELASRGHIVIGCGRDNDRIGQLRRQFTAPHRFDRVDVADDAAVSAWARQVLAERDPPDLLVNNAAVINANAPLWKVSAADFDRVIDVNIKGVANVLRHFLPAMVARGRGVVVNLSSGWGRSTSADVAPYCATKWAIEGLTQALAEELPEGMAAVPLNPGVINTEMLQQAFGDGAAAYPSPQAWARRAVPFLLALGRKDNGRPLTAPDA